MKDWENRVKEVFVNRKRKRGNTNGTNGRRIITKRNEKPTAKKDFTAEGTEGHSAAQPQPNQRQKKPWITNGITKGTNFSLKPETRNDRSILRHREHRAHRDS